MPMGSIRSSIIAILACAAFAALGAGSAAADTIEVPLHVPTIQGAIDSAVDGDTVLVAPGTYVENINFLGKAITVTSESGPEVTIIDGNANGPVVTFISGEGPESVLNGFRVQNGRSRSDLPCSSHGGGICTYDSPTITNNEIINNGACGGLGIEVLSGSPVIEYNVISENFQAGCGGGNGGGIHIVGFSNARIVGNIISNNTVGGAGGGILLNSTENTLIKDNIITGNSASVGGGITMFNDVFGVRIIQNLITENIAGEGSGIRWGNAPAELVNNTIANNITLDLRFQEQMHVSFSRFDNVHLANNNIVAKDDGVAIHCIFYDINHPPNFESNNVFSPFGSAYSALCVDKTGSSGNISVDPLFVDTENGDYRLQADSPVIDAGDNEAPDLPDTDFDGNDRIVDGDDDGDAGVDMGAFEFSATLGVAIDIRPGSRRNIINPRSRGRIPVAILSSAEFDAPGEVDEGSLTFGGTGDEASLDFCLRRGVDMNRDGRSDLICVFRTRVAGFEPGDSAGVLKGETLDGVPIEGRDAVIIVGGGLGTAHGAAGGRTGMAGP